MTEKDSRTLLTIDDEEQIRNTISAYFEDCGYKVLHAENGRSGIEVFRREKPDVILCDLRMPEVDGLDVLNTVKKESSETPIIVVSGTGVLEDAIEAVRLGAWDYVLKPIYDMAILEHAVNKAIEKASLIKKNREYREHLEKIVERRTMQLKKALNGIVEAIVSSLEFKDPYTAGHQKRVANLARAIAGEMKIDSEKIEGIYVAGTIHDIGKISIPSEILAKPAKLSGIEFELVKNHCQAGYDILKKIEFPWPVAKIVLQHHEKINGSGYPLGLTEKDILIEAKIIAVADVVEAMASHRPYRAALGLETALKEIESEKGKTFSSDVVEACASIFRNNKFMF